jgi:CheY-like chemotaxis protein
MGASAHAALTTGGPRAAAHRPPCLASTKTLVPAARASTLAPAGPALPIAVALLALGTGVAAGGRFARAAVTSTSHTPTAGTATGRRDDGAADVAGPLTVCPRSAPGTRDPVHVFLVDDSSTARRMLRRTLRSLPGVAVVGEATTAEQALDRLDRVRADVVVMDWQMPGMTGVEATKRLVARHPDLRVIGYTSSGEDDIHDAFLDAGAAAVFRKDQAGDLRQYLGGLLVF